MNSDKSFSEGLSRNSGNNAPDGITQRSEAQNLPQTGVPTHPIQVEDADEIKPLPAVAMKLAAECRKDQPNMKSVIELIECESAIAARVLSIANSPIYGCAREIDSVPRAVLVLGSRAISNLAISISTQDVFGSKSKCEIYRQSIFEHSLGCAIVSRMLAREIGGIDPAAAFLAGILHDVGKLIYFDKHPETYVQECWGDESVLLENENRVFGVDHTKIGQRYVDNMGLPFEINQAVGSHHDFVERVCDVASVTAVANLLAKQWELGTIISRNEMKSGRDLDRPVESPIENMHCATPTKEGSVEGRTPDLSPYQSLENASRKDFEAIKCHFSN